MRQHNCQRILEFFQNFWKNSKIQLQLCCRITTIDLYNFKFSDFNKEPTSSLKMIRIMIETCWSAFKCFNIKILD